MTKFKVGDLITVDLHKLVDAAWERDSWYRTRCRNTDELREEFDREWRYFLGRLVITGIIDTGYYFEPVDGPQQGYQCSWLIEDFDKACTLVTMKRKGFRY
jgi:hypothetical protein